MKVLFVNTVYAKGSTGTIIRDIGQYLESQGDEYKVAIGRGSDIDDHVHRIGSDFDMYRHALLSRITDRAGFYSKGATRRFVDFIKEYNPDIIHLHNLHGYYINVPILFDYLKHEYKGKIFWTLHDCWSFTGHCTHFTVAGCYKWMSSCSNCPQTRNFPSSYILDSSAKNHRDRKQYLTGIPNLTIIAVSDWLKRVAEDSLFKEYPIKRVYNGINLQNFKPTLSDIKMKHGWENKKIILSVADGFDDRKGLSTILELAEYAQSDWQFLIIGIKKKYIEKLPSNITGVERTPNQQALIKWYSAADVFFNPSIEETFGLVTIEAMACGTPAVVMNSTACPELIVNEDCGVTLEVEASPQDTIKALFNAMQKQGARTGAEHFSVEKQCQGYYELYRNCYI